MPTPITNVTEVFDALEAWINQRPGLEFANYGAIAPYRAEMRSIAKDKARAIAALDTARGDHTFNGGDGMKRLAKYELERLLRNESVYHAAGDKRNVVLGIDPRDGNFDYYDGSGILRSGLAPDTWISEVTK